MSFLNVDPSPLYLQQYTQVKGEADKKAGKKPEVVKESTYRFLDVIAKLFVNPGALAKETFVPDQKELNANRETVNTLKEGPLIISLMPTLKLWLKGVLAKQNLPAKKAILEMLARPEGELLNVIEAALYKGLANLVRASVAAAPNKQKSLADIFMIIQENLKVKTPEGQQKLEQMEATGTLAPIKEMTEADFKKLLMIMFPQKSKDLCIANTFTGNQIAKALWETLKAELPRQLGSFLLFVMEMQKESAKQNDSMSKLEGGHALLGLARIGAGVVQQSVFESLPNTIKAKVEEWLQEVNKAEAAHKEDERAKQLANAVAVITDPKNSHPSHALSKNFLFDRIYAVISQAITHLVHPHLKAAKKKHLFTIFFEAMTPLALEIFSKEGQNFKSQFHAMARKDSNDPARKKWITDTFQPYTQRLLKQVNMDQELSRRDPKTLMLRQGNDKAVEEHFIGVTELLEAQAPEILFNVMGVVFENEPALLAFMAPENSSIENFAFKPLYKVLIDFITAQIMNALPEKLQGETASGIADKIIANLYDKVPHLSIKALDQQIEVEQKIKDSPRLAELINEKKKVATANQELKKWLTEEITRIGADKDYQKLREFIQKNAIEILTNRFHAFGAQKSPTEFLSECAVVMIDTFNKEFPAEKRSALIKQLAKLSRNERYAHTPKALPNSHMDQKHAHAQIPPTSPDERQKLVGELSKEFQPLAVALMKKLGLDQEARLGIIKANAEKEGLIVDELSGQLVEVFRELMGPEMDEKSIRNKLIDIFYRPPLGEDVRVTFADQPKRMRARFKENGVFKKINQFNQVVLATSHKVVHAVQKAIQDVVTSYKLVDELDSTFKLGLEKDLKARELLAREMRRLGSNQEKGVQSAFDLATTSLVPKAISKALLNLFHQLNKPEEAGRKEGSVHESTPEKLIVHLLGILSPVMKFFMSDETVKSKEADAKEVSIASESPATFQQIVKEAVKNILKLVGSDLTSPDHPLALPGMTLSNKQDAWKKAHEVLEKRLGDVFTKLDQREAAQKALKGLESYFGASTDSETRAKSLTACKDFAVVINAYVRDKVVPELLQDEDKMRELLKDFLIEFLNEPQQQADIKLSADVKAAKAKSINDTATVIANWIAPNLKHLADSNLPVFKIFLQFIGNAVEQLSLILMQGFASTFELIDNDPDFMLDLVQDTMKDLNDHISEVNRITKKYKKSNPYEVDPQIMLKEYSQAILHPSLRPVELSEAEKGAIKEKVDKQLSSDEQYAKLSSSKKVARKNQLMISETDKQLLLKQDQQEMKEFFNPLFEDLLVIFDLTEDKLPGTPEMQKELYAMIQAKGPKMLQTQYKEATDSSGQDNIKLNIIELIQKSIDELNNGSTDSAGEADNKDQASTKEKQKQKLIGKSGKFFQESIEWGFKDPIAHAIIKNSKVFKAISQESIASSTVAALHKNPPRKIVSEGIMSATKALHPGRHVNDGAFEASTVKREGYDKNPLGQDKVVEYVKAKKVSFADTPDTKKQKAQWAKERKIENASKIIVNGAKMMTTGINNGISDKFYETCESIADCAYRTLKWIVRSEEIANKIATFFRWLFTGIHKGLQTFIHFSNILTVIHWIQNKVNGGNISVANKNISIPINESATRTNISKRAKKLANLMRATRQAKEEARIANLKNAQIAAEAIASHKGLLRPPVGVLIVEGRRELGVA